MKKKKKTVLWVLILAILFGAVSGGVSAFTNTIVRKIAGANLKFDTTQSYIQTNTTTPVESDVADIVQRCMPSIVSISNKSVTEVMTFFGVYQKENVGSGSGIIIGKNDSELLIVTNYHVVADSKELSVMLSDTQIPTDQKTLDEALKSDKILKAQVKGYDSDKDLAVISVKLDSISAERLEKIKVATIGDSSLVRAGERVIAIGNSLGYGQSVTGGYVSATNRAITMQSQTSQGSTVVNNFIQTDAAINPGNSGGALLNMRGEVIGINSVKIAADGVEGMGYAIPISDVEDIIGTLMTKTTKEVVEKDKQGYMGVIIKDVSTEAQAFGIPQGAYIDEVEEGSAAKKAGIKKGYIVTAFDDYPIKSGAQLQDRVTYYKAGETVKVKVSVPSEEGYKEKEIEITLGKRPKE